MNPEISPEQNAQLSAWVVQRDALLLEISALRTESEKLSKANTEIAESSKGIETRINQSEGRLIELDKKEKELFNKVSIDIDFLTSEKSAIENKIEGLRKEIEVLDDEKNLIIDSIATSTDIYEKVFNRAEVLDKVVDHVTRVSEQNLKDTELLIQILKESVQSVVDINTENVTKAQIIINELPRVFFELQKPPVIKIAKSI